MMTVTNKNTGAIATAYEVETPTLLNAKINIDDDFLYEIVLQKGHYVVNYENQPPLAMTETDFITNYLIN